LANEIHKNIILLLRQNKKMNINYVSHQDAMQLVNSGDRVFIQGCAATPVSLVNALLARAGSINNVELTALSTFGSFNWKTPEVASSFYLNSLFVSDNVREWANGEHGNYVPIFLSEIPVLFDKKILPLDVALVQVSPPDSHGFCNLGVSVDVVVSAVRNATKIIALVNPRMPRVHGDGFVHLSKFAALVWEDGEIPEITFGTGSDEVAQMIGKYVAELVDDGATLQMGIGNIPDAVLHYLTNHKNLGIHTEMFSDGVLSLFEKGIVTNAMKKVERGKIVSTFVLGSRKLYDFVDNNPSVCFLESSFVNDTSVIRRNPKVVSINSAIEIDLTGQICADSIGAYQYSGIGGQMDFMRGASLSQGGKPIIALPSTTKSGISRIVPFLKQGAGVVTTRGHVHYVVTEYGVVNLYGKNMDQRAKALISIAHPNHRESLEQAYKERFRHDFKP
jgi:acyl-CoA hydrolase